MRSFTVGCVVLAFTDDQKAQCELVCAHFQKELAKADALKEWNAFYAHKLCKVLEQQVLTPTEHGHATQWKGPLSGIPGHASVGGGFGGR